jgi:hypothetical protein
MADLEDSMADVALGPVSSRNQVTYIVHHLLLNMVDMVAIEKRFVGLQGEYWTKAVVGKLNHVGINSLKDFIASATLINWRLGAAGHRELLHTTLTMMFEEVAGLMFGTNVGLGVGAS